MIKCTECEHFEILYPPIEHYDSGMAKCKKHNLTVDWISRRTLNRLVCVEDKECAE